MQIIKSSEKQSKNILFFPGATWKRNTMMAPNFIENNFESILVNSNVGLSHVEYDQSDTHQTILRDLYHVSKNYDFLFGYCYGCLPALKLCNENTKGIILLDPSTRIRNTENTYIIELDEAKKSFAKDASVRNMKLFEEFGQIKYSSINCKVLIIYSEYALNNNFEGIKINKIKNKKIVNVSESSHFILMEPKRFEVSQHILEFVNA